MRRNVILGVIVLGVIGFVALQVVSSFIPSFAHTNPPVTFQVQWSSAEVEALARAACYDCHSNETVWPWYSYIAPMSWLVATDVNEARDEWNFSTGEGIDGEDMIDAIRDGEMPPANYLLMHPEANLTPEQQEQLIAGIAATFGGEDDGGDDDDDNRGRDDDDD
jgi:hypothetical protein